MNWYKLSQQILPISILSYNDYGELGISFSGGKKYVYPNVSPYIYNRISALLKNKNYKKVQQMLKNLSSNKPIEPKLVEPKKQITEKQLELFD